MNILIINQPPFNRGDESAHKGLLRALISVRPNIKIKVLFNVFDIESFRQYAIEDRRIDYVCEPIGFQSDYFRKQGIRYGRTFLWHFHPVFWSLKRIYKWADVVVCAPGGICMGGFQNWDHLFHLKLAKFWHKPLAYYGRSFGPFPTETQDNKYFKKISMEMLNYFGFLSIRDHRTEGIAKDLGLSYISTVDTAFLDTPEPVIPYELKMVLGQKAYMVFVPNYLLWHYAYKNRITHNQILNFYCQLMDIVWNNNPNLSIVMLPQLFCGKQYPLRDIDFFRELASKKNDARIIVVADCYSSDIQQSIIRNARYVIGARYHSIVFAINQGTPFISLSYEHKMKGLLESLDMMDYYIDFSETLFSDSNRIKTLNEIKSIIPQLYLYYESQMKAKKIAQSCLDQFLNYLEQYEYQ